MQVSENYAKIMNYIDHNPAAVVGTINADGTPHGSVVYACALDDQKVCFMTKNLTQKYVNINKRPRVSLTFCNEKENSTLQASGVATVLNDAPQIDAVMDKLTRIHARGAEWLPPISKLRAGSYEVIGVDLTSARLAEYRSVGTDSKQVFTEL